MWLLATSVLHCEIQFYLKKRASAEEQTERKERGDDEERNSMCFWLIWLSYL